MITITYQYLGRQVVLAFDEGEEKELQRSFDHLQRVGIHFRVEVVN